MGKYILPGVRGGSSDGPCKVASAMGNLHIYNSLFVCESRILKQTKSLVDNGIFDHVDIVGICQPGLLKEESLGPRRTIHRLSLRVGGKGGLPVEALRFLEFAIRVIWRFRGRRIRVVNVHSLAVLPVGVLFKVLWRKRLVYDTHELETETAGKMGFRKVLAKILERVLIQFADETVAVNASIAKWYQEAYNLSCVHVVRNVPENTPLLPLGSNVLREAFRIPTGHVVFIYQGLLSRDRSVDKLLQLFMSVQPHRHLVFMGSGDIEGVIREAAARLPNVHLHQAVPPDRVLEHTSGADVGLHYIENSCLNHYYCLPNKVFEYIMAGIPLMVRDFPEMGGLVREFDCGWTLPDDESAWRGAIEGITREDVENKKAAVRQARDTLGWHLEEKAYLRAFGRVADGGNERWESQAVGENVP